MTGKTPTDGLQSTESVVSTLNLGSSPTEIPRATTVARTDEGVYVEDGRLLSQKGRTRGEDLEDWSPGLYDESES